MRCKVDLTVASDRPYLVRRESFMKCVDAWDFACRDSTVVRDAYLDSWFRRDGEDTAFNLPAFYLKDGIASFINGRHRTVLLFRHMHVVPMALTQMNAGSGDVLASFVHRELALEEFIDLPDLPIMPPSFFASG